LPAASVIDAVAPSVGAAALIVELQALCANWLAPQITRIARREYQPRPKVINDTIWGSIHLHAWEVAILDSDLLQRLRFLRQLGVAHWLYPSAGHSRLEHSLGVLHQMQALLSALERSSSRADEPLFTDLVGKLLRIAALVHDCGHTVMSHVSEAFIEEMPGVSELCRYLHHKYRARKKPSVSEAFAAVFVGSASFQELLSLPAVGADFIRDVPQACEMIAGFVLGGPVIPNRAFLSLLMSGATDADKLDYMPRDSRMAGVPTPVDVRRVIEKLRVLDVPRARLPSGYARWAGVDDETLKVLVLTSSGARALDELAMGRTVLYEKIYHHHKVRAVEVMVRRALHDSPARSIVNWLTLVDDDLIADTAHFSSLRRRVLLKRALVLAAPGGDVTSPDEVALEEKRWSKLTGPSDGGGRTELDVLREKLVEESTDVARILGIGVEALADQRPEVDRAEPKKLRLDEWAYVGDSGDEIAKANAASGQRSEAGKHAARQLIHFFAPEGAALPVFLAARRLLLTRYGIPTGPEVYRATRLDPDAIQAAEKKLVAANYLLASEVTETNEEARLVSHRQDSLETFLRVAWPRFAELALSFGQYQAQTASRVGPGAIAAFLRQFQTERLARAALRMLEGVEIVDRAHLAGSLRDHLLTGTSIGTVCALGGPGDSSAFVSYLMNDVPKDLRRRVRDLELALEDASDLEILLWDDFCGQGRHTITVLAQWLGLTDPEMLDEDLVDPLSEDRVTRFKNRHVRIAFAVARPSGLALISDFLARHHLDNVAVAPGARLVEERNQLFETDAVIPDSEARVELRDFCVEVGRRLLLPKTLRTDRPLPREELEQRVLGYGNESHLIVFPYNVPTVSLTVLWESDAQWRALFPRRTKPSVSAPAR
jgi:deoxynucleoside triphosphate triphosphohydrolase SAMHD1